MFKFLLSTIVIFGTIKGSCSQIDSQVSTGQSDTQDGEMMACTDNEIKYVYTPCDDHGNRWRVEVPKERNCKLKDPQPPQPGVNCSIQCQPGLFLNIESQICEKCQAGEYSVGDGIRYATWHKLPKGFKTRGFSESHRNKGKEDPCRTAVWIPRGDYLESNGSSCRSVLKFVTDLVKDGNITFTVKSGSEDVFFHVWAEDYKHAYSDDRESSNEMYYTLTSEWKTYTLSLKKGHNTVYFVTSYFENIFESKEDESYESNVEKTIMIKEVVVRGFAYSEHCEKCEAGTYSTPAASSCLPCKRDTFSLGGSGVCELCSHDEYAAPHSSKCLKKKPCKTSDYMQSWEQCEKMQTRKTYQWNEPHICDERHPDSTNLPQAEAYVPCPGCNPGFFSNGTSCLLCPKDTYNEDGNGICEPCGAGTRSVPGLHYKFWRNYPGGNIHLYCLAKPEDGCRSEIGWTTHDTYIASGIGHADDAEQLMYIHVPEGFTRRKSKFKMTFAIICPSEKCRMKIQSIESADNIQDIKTIVGNVEETTFEHTRYSLRRTRYRIVFDKKYHKTMQTYKYSTSRLQIFEIEVTDVKGGGAERCERCSTSGNEQSCIKCDPGNYIRDGKCIKCPKDTYISDNDGATDIAACKKCPPFTVSSPGSRSCHSDCKISLKRTREQSEEKTFNLTALAGMHIVNGPEQFTTKGYNYHHSYHISICGHPYQQSICINNASKTGHKEEMASKVEGAICRTTIIPDRNTVLSAQPISIGSKIRSVVIEPTLNELNETIKKDISVDRVTGDIVFTFHSKRLTEVCENGTSGTVRLICDPNSDGKGKLSIGDDDCKSETCDGCRYHFKFKSVHACTQCSKHDYVTIQSACTDGKKTIHHIWKEPRSCVGGVEKPEDETAECTIFEKSILDFKVIILGFLLFGILLAVIVLVLCYRNRRLSYKYSRLIDASHTKDGELPAAETCMDEEGEEEDEIILSRSGGHKPKILDRLKGMRGKKEDFSGFETINLDSMKLKDEFDDSD